MFQFNVELKIKPIKMLVNFQLNFAFRPPTLNIFPLINLQLKAFFIIALIFVSFGLQTPQQYKTILNGIFDIRIS